MVGSYDMFDRVDYTSPSEWSSRNGEQIDTEQIHHTAYPDDEGSRRLMDKGGRSVSANGLLLQDGTLVEVVPVQYRAHTSASGYDRRSLTIEVVNQSGGPEWRISEKQRVRLAKLAQDMHRHGLLGGLNRRYIIGHNETPGSYPTACPGPDMNVDHIAALAAGPTIGAPPTPTIPPIRKETTMHLAYIPKAAPDGKGTLFLLFGEKFYLEFTGQPAADAFARQIGGNAAPASRSFFDKIARQQGITERVEVVILDDEATPIE